MKSYRNPFRARTSEQMQQQGLHRFLKTYGADVLDLLPDDPWDRPVLIRSAPGGGKTSLLRVFTIDALQAVIARPDDYEDLHRRMSDLGALDVTGPLVLGLHVPLAQGFRDLMDLGASPEVSKRLFFRLVDAQIMREACRGIITFAGRSWPEDLEALTVLADSDEVDLDRLGGNSGRGVWDAAVAAEQEITRMLDSVLPIRWDTVTGHGALHSLKALSISEMAIDGIAIKVRPLVMFDDGQDLAAEQRDALLGSLTDRSLTIGRWYTERYSALTPEEIIGDGEPRRAHYIVPLESKARTMGGQLRNGRRVRAFEAMLLDIADRRARKSLEDYADESEASFGEFLDSDDTSRLDERSDVASSTIRRRVMTNVGDVGRYEDWLATAEPLRGYAAAVRWREIEIVVTRDRDRAQLELLNLPLTADDLKTQSDSSIRDAAALFLRQEFRLPYYFGSAKLAKLGSQNVEQFLELSGQLFDEMLALVTLGERPWLDPSAQDRIVRATSDTFWRNIPKRRSFGRDIQHLLLQVGTLAHRDTYREKAPYAPGVTGTALSMRDVDRLLDPAVRRKVDGADKLFRALSGAIGHNLLFAEPNRSVKNNQWLVLYLNRMLCARFGLPLGYGGFRERPLEQMCAWMAEPTVGDLSGVEVPTLFDNP